MAMDKCEICGKDAVWHFHKVWKIYKVTKFGPFELYDEIYDLHLLGRENEEHSFCDEHAEQWKSTDKLKKLC